MGSKLLILLKRYHNYKKEKNRAKKERLRKQKFYNDLLNNPPEGTQDMLHLISSLQGERINDQRAELRPVNSQGTLPGRSMPTSRPKPEEDFIEVLARVQGTRLEDQRTALPAPTPKPEPEEADEEDFFARLMRAQAGRMEDQRATIPPKNQPSNSKN